MKKFKILLILSLILVLFYLKSSKGGGCAGTSKKYGLPHQPFQRRKSGIGLTSYSREDKCECEKFFCYELTEEIEIKPKDNLKMTLKYKNDQRIGQGGVGSVKHTYWEERGICVALKECNDYENDLCKKFIDNEIKFLKYFSEIENESVIFMYGYEKQINESNESITYIVMELATNNLQNYCGNMLSQKQPSTWEELQNLLFPIIKNSAQVLAQFHEHDDAIHLDIKSTNYVVFQDKENPELIKIKLIDFNTSAFLNDPRKKCVHANGTAIFNAPEIRKYKIRKVKMNKPIKLNKSKKTKVTRKADVWAFGLMIYEMFHNKREFLYRLNGNLNAVYNDNSIDERTREQSLKEIYKELDNELNQYRANNNYNTFLDDIIKACIQIKPEDRFSMKKVVNLMNGYNVEDPHNEDEGEILCEDDN